MKRSEEILAFIVKFQQENGYAPSVRGIGEAVGLRSVSTVHGHLARLEKHGYIKRNGIKARALEVIKK